jgi:mannose-6-phosphate isomerase-like protein (cupin superfamily)
MTGDGVSRRPVRRVVTGLGADGRSRVIFDGEAANVMSPDHYPGVHVAMLWLAGQVPASNAGNSDAAAGPFRTNPPPGGVSFLLVQMPPDTLLAGRSAEEIERIKAPHGMIETASEGGGKHPGMHATNTVEFTVMLSGEQTLLLEDGEVTLRAGDTLVNRGISHAWENRGKEPALKAVICIDAEPLVQLIEP